MSHFAPFVRRMFSKGDCGPWERSHRPAPGGITDEREQYRITFTPAGDTAYFGAADGFFPQTREANICRSVQMNGEWQPPGVTPFSGEHSDIDPFITPDGQFL